MPPVRSLHVDLGADSYRIHIEPGILARAGDLIRPHLGGGPVLIVADATVHRLHGADLAASLRTSGITCHVATFPAGEPAKTVTTAEQVWAACAAHHIDRSGAIIALGGGVSGDLAGFVAACWMRGIDFVQVPTSLLAMVDSSVGGKTGVNSSAGKNLVGAFKQPRVVIIDPTLLTSMEDREYRSGLAEVLKYGVIKEPAFLAWQEDHAEALTARDPEAVGHAVAESCRIKAWYVGEDPLERGVRAHLNYGHTFAHALERETGYRRFLHGEAVGIGMRMAERLARRLGLLRDDELAERQDALLSRYGLPLSHTTPDPATVLGRLVEHCRLDKKVTAGRWRFVLPTAIGSVKTTDLPAAEDVLASFAHAVKGGG